MTNPVFQIPGMAAPAAAAPAAAPAATPVVTGPVVPTARPATVGAPQMAAIFTKLADAKQQKGGYLPKLLPSKVQRDPNVTDKGDANVLSSQEAWYVCEVLNQSEDGKIFKTEVKIHSSTGDTPTDTSAEITMWENSFSFADESADLISALANVHIKQPDPESKKHYPLVVRLFAEACGEQQKFVGKFVAVKVLPYRAAKKPNKETGLIHQYTRSYYYPIEAVRDAAGNITGFAPPAVDNRTV